MTRVVHNSYSNAFTGDGEFSTYFCFLRAPASVQSTSDLLLLHSNICLTLVRVSERSFHVCQDDMSSGRLVCRGDTSSG